LLYSISDDLGHQNACHDHDLRPYLPSVAMESDPEPVLPTIESVIPVSFEVLEHDTNAIVIIAMADNLENLFINSYFFTFWLIDIQTCLTNILFTSANFGLR
jgi:hypothetical protein